MLRSIVSFAAACLLASSALAADLTGPPRKIDAQGEPKPGFHGCYVGGAAGGLFLTEAGAGVSASTFGVEAGCDLQRAQVVFGVRAGYDFGEADTRIATIGGRVGFTINPHSLLYGTINLAMDGRKPDFRDGILSAGLGLEMYAFTPSTTLFIEGAKDIKTTGGLGLVDEAWTIRAGVRYRF